MSKMIEIGVGDAAVVFRADGSMEMAIPETAEGSEIEVDGPVWRAMMCALVIKDKDVRTLAERKMTEGL